jgi:hypothetical protein
MASVPRTVKWLDEPEHHDYDAALDYLTLLMTPEQAEPLVHALRHAKQVERAAKDILRASELELLPETNFHVAKDLAKPALSPILLVRDPSAHRLIVADGYHRVCAAYWIAEDTAIPCRLV